MNTEALQKISKFGLYQKRIAFILLLAALVGTPLLFGSVFIMYLPSHRCYVPQFDDNATDSNVDFERVDDEATLSLYLPIEISSDGVKRWSECYRYNYTSQPSFNSSSPKAANQSLVYCDKGWKYNKPDAVTSATTEFNLVCDQSLVRPLFPALQMSGFMVGSLLGGILSDRYGRRKAMLFSMTSLAASILWVGLSQSVLALQIGIFVFGISIIMRAVTSFVLLNEVVCGDRRRTLGILFSVFCAVAGCILPVIAYFVTNWRWMTVILGIVLVITLPLFYWFLRESLGWLIQNKRHKEAEKLFKEIAKLNKIKLNLDDTLLPDEKLDGETDDVEDDVMDDRKFSYYDLITVSFLLKRILILSFMWFSMNMCFYGLSLNSPNLGGNRYVNAFVASAVEIPGQFLCYVLVKKIGCRKSYSLMGVACGIFTLITPFMQTISQLAGVVCAMIAKFFSGGPFTVLYLITGDLFPTMLRTQSYGACSFMGRIASIIVPYVLYLGKTVHFALPYIVMGTIGVISAMAGLMLPETTGQPLPKTLEEARLQDRPFSCRSKQNEDKINGNIL